MGSGLLVELRPGFHVPPEDVVAARLIGGTVEVDWRRGSEVHTAELVERGDDALLDFRRLMASIGYPLTPELDECTTVAKRTRPVRIRKEVEFDAAHRVPSHGSKCRHVHGHRYRVLVTLAGETVDNPGAPDDGMLVDFSDLKGIMVERIHDRFDHGAIIAESDNELLQALSGHGWKLEIVPFIPTAENLAIAIYEDLVPAVHLAFDRQLTVELVEVYETPSSWASYGGAR